MTTLLRYQADIWVEVDLDELDVVAVVVDQATLVDPVEFLDRSAVADDPIGRAAEARHVADGIDWPSWEVGDRPA